MGCKKQREVDENLLQDRNGLWYLPNEEAPFTGVAGKELEYAPWYRETTYKDGKPEVGFDKLEARRDGLRYFEGKPFTGVAVNVNEFGGGKSETPYKDGNKHGLYTLWHRNGQKWQEVTYKDGKLNGQYTVWSYNGQKLREGSYKAGELISGLPLKLEI